MLTKSCLAVAAAMVLAACTAATHQSGQPPGDSHTLYQLLPGSEREALARTPGAHGYLKYLLQAPSTEDIRLVTLTPSLVSSTTSTLSLPLMDGSTVQFKRLRSNDSQPGMTGWVGDVASNRQGDFPASSEVVMDPFSWISLMRQGDQVVGDVHVKGQAYRLEPIGNGQHVLVKVDESKLPPEAEPIPAPKDASADLGVGKAPSSAHSTIRVLFVTTNQSRDRYPDNRLRLAQALQTANQFLINSHVDLTYEIAGFYDATYDETGQDSSAQLAAVRSDQTALGKAVYAQRDVLGADLVAMLSTFKEVCGRAYLNANKALGYSVISCLAGTLGHELGHNLGVHHGWEPGDSVPNPPYMHGYRRTAAPALHTVMMTSQGAIPYFSNPRLTYQGVAIGTPEHHDAARRFNERRETVENFYPPSVFPTVRLWPHGGQSGTGCYFEMTPDSYVQLSWHKCNGPTHVTVKDFSAGRELCFTNLLGGVNYCYSGTFQGDFAVEIQTGAGRPAGLNFTKTKDGAVSKVTYK